MDKAKFKNLQVNFDMASNDLVLYPYDESHSWCQKVAYPTDSPQTPDVFTEKNQLSLWKTSRKVTLLWILLSTLVTLTCSVGFIHDEWFVRESGSKGLTEGWPLLTYDRNTLLCTLGMFSVCRRNIQSTEEPTCRGFEFDLFPSTTWQSSCFLYGIGCFLQGCGLLAIFLCIIIPGPVLIRRYVAHLISHVYVLAGLLQTMSLFLFPVVLHTPMGRSYCGSLADDYSPDQCRVGWAYVAATAGTLLTFYCPFLAYFSFYRLNESPD